MIEHLIILGLFAVVVILLASLFNYYQQEPDPDVKDLESEIKKLQKELCLKDCSYAGCFTIMEEKARLYSHSKEELEKLQAKLISANEKILKYQHDEILRQEESHE